MSKNPLFFTLKNNIFNGQNYSDWVRNLRILLKYEHRVYVVDQPVMPPPEAGALDEEVKAYNKWVEDDLQVKCIMLAGMAAELQEQHMDKAHAYDIYVHLREMYGDNERFQRLAASTESFRAQLQEGGDVQVYGLKMLRLIEKLKSLGFSMDATLQIDLILFSLPPSFDLFRSKFYMQNQEPDLLTLVNMLKTEQTMKKREVSQRARVKSKDRGQSSNGKQKVGVSEGGVKKKKKRMSKPKKEGKGKCFNCGEKGHWKDNCLKPKGAAGNQKIA